MGKLLYLNHLIFPYRKTINDSKGFTGKGVATYPNGDVFEGEWVDGLRSCSQGTYTYANLAKPSEEGTQAPAEVYTGSWSNNNKQGIGKQNYNGLGHYYGHRKNGEKDGEGVMIYVNKDIYSGQWKNGKKEGQGTYISNDTGMKFVGAFKGGNLINGNWIYPNGTFFEGNFDNNQPKGEGKWHFENGNVVRGLYTQIVRADIDNQEIKLAWKTLSNITTKE